MQLSHEEMTATVDALMVFFKSYAIREPMDETCRQYR